MSALIAIAFYAAVALWALRLSRFYRENPHLAERNPPLWRWFADCALVLSFVAIATLWSAGR